MEKGEGTKGVVLGVGSGETGVGGGGFMVEIVSCLIGSVLSDRTFL